ncbi:MAG: hypothetical protein V3R72_10725 [Gammaproteobacteria bacterium]
MNFHYRQLTLYAAKGRRDRVTVLPNTVQDGLTRQLERVKALLRDRGQA